MSNLSAPHFHNEEAAYAYIEARVWPQGAVCPHCGGYERIGKMGGKSTRIGAYKCYQCRKPFTVTVGTIFEDSPLGLEKWLPCVWLIVNCKNGVSSWEIHRALGVTQEWAENNYWKLLPPTKAGTRQEWNQLPGIFIIWKTRQ